VSMEIQGLPVLGQPIPPRPPKPAPPGVDELAAQVAAAAGKLQDATALERHLEGERMTLKAQQKALEQDRMALSQRRLPPRQLHRRAAELLDRRLELEEEDFALKRRQDAARVQAGVPSKFPSNLYLPMNVGVDSRSYKALT
jgi:hypothetical protein